MELSFTMFVTTLEKKFLAYAKTRLKEVDLSFGYVPFILYIGKYPNCTQASLTNASKIDWGHSQRSIRKLEEEGFITRSYLENDKKNYHLALTSKGLNAYKLSKNLFKEFDDKTLDNLSSNERQILMKLLAKIVNPLLGDEKCELRKDL